MKLDDNTRLFDLLQKIQEGQTDIRERVTRVEGKLETFEERLETHYEQNQKEHNDLVVLLDNYRKDLIGKIKENTGAIEAIKNTIATIRDKIGSQTNQLAERKGERRVLAKSWQLIIAFIGGGGLAGVVWIITKLFK